MLVVVVAIGFIRKVNLGFLSIGVAFALGTFGGMSAKAIELCIRDRGYIVIRYIVRRGKNRSGEWIVKG